MPKAGIFHQETSIKSESRSSFYSLAQLSDPTPLPPSPNWSTYIQKHRYTHVVNKPPKGWVKNSKYYDTFSFPYCFNFIPLSSKRKVGYYKKRITFVNTLYYKLWYSGTTAWGVSSVCVFTFSRGSGGSSQIMGWSRDDSKPFNNYLFHEAPKGM